MVWDLTAEPCGDTYVQLLEFCSHHCSNALLVVREWDWLEEDALEILERLRRFRISATESAEWPGTRLMNETATVYIYSLQPEVLQILQGASSRLYDWRQPAKPEDLCFMRTVDIPFLTSTSHEKDAYLDLSDGEFDELSRVFPQVADLLRSHV